METYIWVALYELQFNLKHNYCKRKTNLAFDSQIHGGIDADLHLFQNLQPTIVMSMLLHDLDILLCFRTRIPSWTTLGLGAQQILQKSWIDVREKEPRGQQCILSPLKSWQYRGPRQNSVLKVFFLCLHEVLNNTLLLVTLNETSRLRFIKIWPKLPKFVI